MTIAPDSSALASPILIDDRERASGLAEALRALGARVEVTRLALGDARIGARIVVERKSAGDFIDSLLDGRLERQIHALAAWRGQALVIVEGEFGPHALAGMPAAEVRAALLALQLDWRLPLVRSLDVEDTARWIVALARRDAGQGSLLARGLTPPAAARPHPAPHRATRPKRGEAFLAPAPAAGTAVAPLAALRRVPGLGAKKAAALLAHFGSMTKLFNAGETELAQAPGIGPILAREIYGLLHR